MGIVSFVSIKSRKSPGRHAAHKIERSKMAAAQNCCISYVRTAPPKRAAFLWAAAAAAAADFRLVVS
jgi:hypothetical protein